MIAIVSHDAGGAEMLSSHVRRQDLACIYSLAGPAVHIFERKLGKIGLVPLDEAIRKCDWLLCGTSWQSDLEWRAIGSAKECGKKSVAFLDHWVNYRERFIRNGDMRLPDEVWVGDTHAERIAHDELPEVVINMAGNPYFEDLKMELAAIAVPERKGCGLNVLIVTEPLREHGLQQFGDERHWGYTEEEALNHFLSNLHVLGQPVGRISIRPHPSEPEDKYDWVAREYKLPIFRGGLKTLLEEISEHDVVVGFESMAMIVGLLANKPVCSCIPPGGTEMRLPYMEIRRLFT